MDRDVYEDVWCNENFIYLTWKTKLQLIPKIFRTKWINREYSIDELIDDDY